MSALPNPAIPKGSLVVVTGVNGWVGSQVANQFLASGYRVRGTVRDIVKSAWLTALFNGKYGTGNFELVIVKDMNVDGAFDNVTKGASAFIHTASIITFDQDAEKVIPATVAGALNGVKAAYAEPTVKRFVLTSSSAAVLIPETGQSDDVTLDEDSYGEELIQRAKTDLEPGFVRACLVYGASKALAEKAVWDYVEENKSKRPDLVVNSVLPAQVFGEHLDPVNQGTPSTSASIPALWNGLIDGLKLVLPQYAIHAQDVGLLHVAGAIHPDVENRRLYGYAHKFNWDKILEILREQNPQRKFVDDFHTGETKTVIKTWSYSEQLIRDISGHGWTSLEDIVRDNTKSLVN
ncbi:NAD(P)-binding protein [Aspergillus californicus]